MSVKSKRQLAALLAVMVLLSLIILGLSSRIQAQMEQAATENVREIVKLMGDGVSALRQNDVACAENLAQALPEGEISKDLLARFQEGSPFARLSFVAGSGITGISSGGEDYSPPVDTEWEPSGGTCAVTDVYLSDLGAWTYTVRCPVYAGDTRTGALYADVVMERYREILPDMIFREQGPVYILDAESLRFIYEPTSTNVFISSKYDLHGFLSDFGILDETLEREISAAISERQSTIAKMSIYGESTYVYFWPVDRGEWYLCGIISEANIQGESKAVTQTIVLVSVLLFTAAAAIFGAFYWGSRKNQRARQYQIDLFHGIAKSIDHVVLLYDCSSGKLELAFDNIGRILGIGLGQLNQLMGTGEPSGAATNERLLQLLRPQAFPAEGGIHEKVEWSSPETGERQWLEVESSYITLSGKRKYILSILDVTKEEQMQESLRASMLAAQEASRVKSDFLSQMSHEIRTPMNAVLGMAQIAETKLDDRSRVADCLKKIKASSRHLLGLINDILDISKIENRKLSLSQSWFTLDGLLSDIQTIISVQAAVREQTFILHSEAGQVELYADRMRLSQIMVNLLNNSVKYTPRGGRISLFVSLSPSMYGGLCHFHFKVSDNGIGMSKAFQEKLFLPFEREEDQDVRAQTGTGLGLPIVQSMVSLMGGTIQVESEKGAGTTFYVDLEMKCKAGEGNSPAEAVGQDAPTDLGGMVILLAEDNELNREIATEFLKMAGVRVECAVDGVDAFGQFQTSAPGHFHLILMDMQMPRWDGLEATRHIRALGRPDAKTVPILAVTANAYLEDEQKCLAAGMDDHLAKPLELREFYQKVKKYLPAGAGSKGENDAERANKKAAAEDACGAACGRADSRADRLRG